MLLISLVAFIGNGAYNILNFDFRQEVFSKKFKILLEVHYEQGSDHCRL